MDKPLTLADLREDSEYTPDNNEGGNNSKEEGSSKSTEETLDESKEKSNAELEKLELEKLELEKKGKEKEEEEESSKKDDSNEEEPIELSDKAKELLEKGTKNPESLTKEEIALLKKEGVQVESSESDTNFWKEFESKSGEELKLDFGDTDPESVDGVLKYAEAFRDKGVRDYDNILKSIAPKAYQAMLIEKDGGDPKELFISDPSDSVNYSSIKIEEDNTKQHKQIYRKYLSIKGNSDSEIEDLLEVAEDKGLLKDRATSSLDYIKKVNKEHEEAVIKRNTEKKEQDNNNIDIFSNKLDEIISEGAIGSFSIPKADKKKFVDFLGSNIQYDDGSFKVVQDITDKNLNNILENLFFSFKQGDIDKLIEVRANTKQVSRLKKSIPKIVLPNSKSESASNKKPTLGDII